MNLLLHSLDTMLRLVWRKMVITMLLSQEKIDNIKNSATFPREAIQAVLTERKLTSQKIDEVVIAGTMIVPQHCINSQDIEAF